MALSHGLRSALRHLPYPQLHERPAARSLRIAYLDGASHWTAFWRLAVPLSVPALASLGIFQFLWVWNDLLVALVFLGSGNPVLTWQINNLVGRFTGQHLLSAAAFVSMVLPMVVFFSMQQFFVRGLAAGAVKG